MLTRFGAAYRCGMRWHNIEKFRSPRLRATGRGRGGIQANDLGRSPTQFSRVTRELMGVSSGGGRSMCQRPPRHTTIVSGLSFVRSWVLFVFIK